VWTEERPPAGIVWRERALFAATVGGMGLLLGPGFGLVNAICGPAADALGAMSWPELVDVDPEGGFVRAMTALGLILAVRLLAGVLLACVARVPGRIGARAARWSIYVTPPLARRWVRVLIGVSLSGWTGAALATPALAATQPTATVVPAPVLAPPEATVQIWPDLGRPGTAAPMSPAPRPPSSAGHRPWPDLGRAGTDVPRATASLPSAPASEPSTSAPGPRPTSSRANPPGGHPPADHPEPALGPRSTPVTSPRPASDVVVAPGDCLWTLAEHQLERGGQALPSGADVAAATQEWWQANRAVIGADPDRLMPGEQLRPPG
jgi:hypothetical protein